MHLCETEPCRHKCEQEGCDNMILYHDEPYCFTHSPDEGSSFRNYDSRTGGWKWQLSSVKSPHPGVSNVAKKVNWKSPQKSGSPASKRVKKVLLFKTPSQLSAVTNASNFSQAFIPNAGRKCSHDKHLSEEYMGTLWYLYTPLYVYNKKYLNRLLGGTRRSRGGPIW